MPTTQIDSPPHGHAFETWLHLETATPPFFVTDSPLPSQYTDSWWSDTIGHDRHHLPLVVPHKSRLMTTPAPLPWPFFWRQAPVATFTCFNLSVFVFPEFAIYCPPIASASRLCPHQSNSSDRQRQLHLTPNFIHFFTISDSKV